MNSNTLNSNGERKAVWAWLANEPALCMDKAALSFSTLYMVYGLVVRYPRLVGSLRTRCLAYAKKGYQGDRETRVATDLVLAIRAVAGPEWPGAIGQGVTSGLAGRGGHGARVLPPPRIRSLL